MRVQEIHANGFNPSPVLALVGRAAESVGTFTRTGQTLATLSATHEAKAHCTLIAGVLEGFIQFCYQGENGIFWNLSGNWFIPAGTVTPWASAGKRRGEPGRARLTVTERSVVSAWLRSLAHNRGEKPVFCYDAKSRRWYVDTVRHSNLPEALSWLTRNAMTPDRYLVLRGALSRT